MKKLLTSILFAGLLLPSITHASSLTLEASILSEISSVKTKIDELQSQLVMLQKRLEVAQEEQRRFVASSTPSTPTTPSVSCSIPLNTLSYGSKSQDVTVLQTFLAKEGYLSAYPTGFYGNATKEAVGKWQLANGVVQTTGTGYGVVGKKTLSYMSEKCGNRDIVRACPMIYPVKPECTNGKVTERYENGCLMGYTCKETKTTLSCPQSMPPECANGQLVNLGTDQNGCSVGYSCVSKPISCPAPQMVNCSGATLVPLGKDVNGCDLGYTCRAN